MSGLDEIAGQVAAAQEAAKSKAEARKGGAGRSGKAQRRKGGHFPFRVDDGRIWREAEDGEGGKKWVPFGSELHVLARTRTAEGEEHGLLLEVVDQDGLTHQWAMPMALLGGSGEPIRTTLLGLGWRPEPAVGPKWRDWLISYLIGVEPEDRARCVSRIGWHGTSFVLPDETFGAGGEGERVILQTGERLDHALAAAGDLKGWQAAIAAPALGNSRLVLALSAAFAAPLLVLTGDDGGGFHFRGGSSSGKSTALTVAGSVWGGGGVRGYVQSWRATDNALEALAAMHNGALLCLDELSQVEPKAAGQAAYMLGNGVGKARAGREGQARKALEWKLLFLSNGEVGLADKIKEGGGRIAAGMEVRVVDLRADAGAGLGIFERVHDAPDAASFAQRLKRDAGRFYGTAARAFLRALASDLTGSREEVAGLRKAFVAKVLPAGSDGQVKRVADRFALVAAAGELASFHGVTGWPQGEALAAAERCFRDWLAQRGGVGSSEVADARARLRRAIEIDGHSRFLPWRHDARTVVRTNTLGYLQRADDEAFRPDPDGAEVRPDAQPVYYFTPSGMKELLAGLDEATVLEGLAELGVIVRQTVTVKGKPTPALNKVFKVPFEGRAARLIQLNFVALMSDRDGSA